MLGLALGEFIALGKLANRKFRPVVYCGRYTIFHSPSSRTSWFKDLLKESKVTFKATGILKLDFKFAYCSRAGSGIIWMRISTHTCQPVEMTEN